MHCLGRHEEKLNYTPDQLILPFSTAFIKQLMILYKLHFYICEN